MSRRLSGLQREVLSLYRECLRLVRSKPPEARAGFRDLVVSEFKTRAQTIARTDRHSIEYFLRRGRRQLETLSSPGVRIASKVHAAEAPDAHGGEASSTAAPPAAPPK